MSAHCQPAHPAAELEALLAAIAQGIDALVTWDIAAFQSAAQRQSEICDSIASSSAMPHSTAEKAVALQVRELSLIYVRLLQHSIHWTHTLRTILQNGGHSPYRASVHFRG